MEIEDNTKVSPGTLLGSLEEYDIGSGVYVKDGEIFSALLGIVKIVDNEAGKASLSVDPMHKKPKVTPTLRDVVLAQVTLITPQYCKVNIICVGEEPLSDTYPGMIRLSDVRQTHTDQLEMYKCFRPGDIIRAEIISMGDTRSFYLSTARNEYGVILAKSMSGSPMVPVSWNLMQCPTTKLKEYRKVAKSA